MAFAVCDCLMTGAENLIILCHSLLFSECNERLSFVAIKCHQKRARLLSPLILNSAFLEVVVLNTYYNCFLYIDTATKVYSNKQAPFKIMNRGLLKSKNANTKFVTPMTTNIVADIICKFVAVRSAFGTRPIENNPNKARMTPSRRENKGGSSTITIPAKYRSILLTKKRKECGYF